MNKKFAALGLIVSLSVIGTACGNSGSSTPSSSQSEASKAPSATTAPATGVGAIQIDKPITIEYWHAMTGQLEKTLQQLADEFHKQNPNITIKLVAQGNYGDLSQKLMAAAKAKTSPAMAQAYANWQTDYISNGLLEDLTPYMNDAKVGLSKEEQSDIVPAFMSDTTWDGKLYGLPFNKSTQVLYYNQDYLDQVKLTVPKTWDELKTAAKTLTTTINGKKVVGIGFENSVSGDLATYVKQAGGEYVTADGQVKFNSPEGEKALSYLYDLVVTTKTGRLAGEDGYMSNPFGRGEVAMYVGSSAGASFVGQAVKGAFKWSTAALPQDKAAASPFQGTNNMIFKSGSDQQKLAAWMFAKFLTSTESTTTWAMATGYVPVRSSALKSAAWTTFTKEHPEQAAASMQFNSAFGEPHLKGFDQLRTNVSKILDSVLLGKETVKNGLSAAEQAAKDSLKK